MLRFMVPYLIPGLALAMLAGGLYGGDVIGVPATYGISFLGLAIMLAGYVRWDLHRYPPDDRR